MKCVYLIKTFSDNTFYYKIGNTNNIDNRIRNLSTGTHLKYELLKIYKSDKSVKIEKHLHIYFKAKKTKGEWFELNEKDVDSFDNLCEKYNKIANILKENPFY